MPVPADVKADITITPSVTPTEDGRATPGGARIVSLTRKAKFSDLDADEKEELRLLRETWSYELKTYQRQSEAYRGLGAIIQASIDHKYLLYTFNCETPWHMMHNLKLEVALSDRAQKGEILEKWKKLKTIAKSSIDIESWLKD